jgi:vacuolar-type H+-ATPase subunit D/Vma8
MNASQLIAWLVCLAVAFLACVVTVHNFGRVSLLSRQVDRTEQKLQAVSPAAEELKLIRQVLERMEKRMDSGEATPETEKLEESIQELSRRVNALEDRIEGGDTR